MSLIAHLSFLSHLRYVVRVGPSVVGGVVRVPTQPMEYDTEVTILLSPDVLSFSYRYSFPESVDFCVGTKDCVAVTREDQSKVERRLCANKF